MIRLIAADLDGTLLNSEHKFSKHLFPLIAELKDRGVYFAPASGRQYYNLRELFEPVAQDLIFICENGAVVFQGNHELFVDQISPDAFLAPIETVRSLPDTHAVLCGIESAYIEDTEPIFIENARMYYKEIRIVSNLNDVLSKDKLFKLAVFCKDAAETTSYPALIPCRNRFQVVLSGRDWVDLMNPATNKGTALHRVMEIEGLVADECMAFGDYLNDVELLQAVTHSYAMANAHPALKKFCRYQALSNDEDGVVRAIRKYLLHAGDNMQ